MTTPAIDEWSVEWLRRNRPGLPDLDPRCISVLTSWQAIYNINPEYDADDPERGFHDCGGGAILIHGHWSLSTFDFDGLTRLVLAAHRYLCRVDIGPAHTEYVERAEQLSEAWDPDADPDCDGLLSTRAIAIMVHPRKSGGSGWERHPGLSGLIEQCAS